VLKRLTDDELLSASWLHLIPLPFQD